GETGHQRSLWRQPAPDPCQNRTRFAEMFEHVGAEKPIKSARQKVDGGIFDALVDHLIEALASASGGFRIQLDADNLSRLALLEQGAEATGPAPDVQDVARCAGDQCRNFRPG